MFVLNITLPNNVGEDDTFWVANSWTKQVLQTAVSDRAELSYTAVSNGVLCAVRVYLFISKLSIIVGWGEQS
jgi:hypothetical protein